MHSKITKLFSPKVNKGEGRYKFFEPSRIKSRQKILSFVHEKQNLYTKKWNCTRKVEFSFENLCFFLFSCAFLYFCVQNRRYKFHFLCNTFYVSCTKPSILIYKIRLSCTKTKWIVYFWSELSRKIYTERSH